jgi:hypothetical protein
MRVLMQTLSGWATYATLRATQLGVSRRRVLLTVGSLMFLTLGVAVFRASRSSTAPPGLPHVTTDLAPTPAEVRAATAPPEGPHVTMDLASTPAEVRAATRPSEPEPPPVVPTSDDLRQAEPAADLVNPFTGMTLQEEQEARGVAQRAQADQRRLELTKLDVEIAKQEQELARVRKETQDLLRPPPRPVAPRVPAIPDAQPLAVASQRALVLYRGARVTARPGSTLGSWTVDAVLPDGVVLRYQEQRAFLPLSFPTRTAN